MIKVTSKPVDMIIHELNHSGVSNAAITLANGLIQRGISTRLVVIGKENDAPFPTHKELEIKFLGISKSKNKISKILYVIKAFIFLSWHLAQQKSCNVFVWAKEFTALAVMLRILLPLKFKLIGVNASNISAHLKNNTFIFFRPILKLLYKCTIKHADCIITQSNDMLNDLCNNYDVSKNKIINIYPPINAKFFQTTPTPRLKTHNILFVGKLIDYKAPFTVIEIFNKLSTSSATLQFVGEGELEESLKAKVAELGLNKRVSFAGKQDNILPFLQDATILILTSRYEGFGMVLVEAIASGVPVISFDCPTGPAEIIINDVNGYLIPLGNIDLFAKKLDYALTKHWDREKIIETANKFHPDIVINKYFELIKEKFYQ